MSRIGSNPIKVASGVEVKVEKGLVEVKGPKGTLSQNLPEDINVEVKDGEIIFSPANDNKKEKKRIAALWGLARALVNNMVIGVTEGYSKTLEINGVGYKVQVQGKTLKMNLGFSHEVNFPIPEGITMEAAKPTELKISGVSKQKVGQVAAEIRSYRKPEPYKGKGIRYSDEYVRRKEGKKK